MRAGRFGSTFLLALLLASPLVQAGAPTPGVSPSDPRHFTWVVPGVLAVGGGGLTKPQVDWLHEQGFRAIADFRAEHRDPEEHVRAKGIEFLDMPVEHAVDMNVSQVRDFVAWAKAQEAAGRPMYVHCTNGWHRAAAFSVAWRMDREGLSYDEAAKLAVERRPGTVMRAPAALLAYEAERTGRPGLTVMLLSPLSRPEPGGTMPVTVEALAGGRPATGAKVKVWSEESGLRLGGVTDEAGRFTFTYRAPPEGVFMDHLYARVSLDGFVDGADNVELFYGLPVHPGPLAIEAEWTPQGVRLEVLKGGRPVRSHVVATTQDGAWSHAEMSSGGRVLVPLPDPARPLVVRAERWGAEGASVTVAPPSPPAPRGVRIAAEEPPAPSDAPLPALPPAAKTPEEDPPPSASPAGGSTLLAQAEWRALALGMLLLGGSAFVLLRRRDPPHAQRRT